MHFQTRLKAEEIIHQSWQYRIFFPNVAIHVLTESSCQFWQASNMKNCISNGKSSLMLWIWNTNYQKLRWDFQNHSSIHHPSHLIFRWPGCRKAPEWILLKTIKWIQILNEYAKAQRKGDGCTCVNNVAIVIRRYESEMTAFKMHCFWNWSWNLAEYVSTRKSKMAILCWDVWEIGLTLFFFILCRIIYKIYNIGRKDFSALIWWDIPKTA